MNWWIILPRYIQNHNSKFPPNTKEYKIYELEEYIEKEVCNKTTCEENCVTIKDTA